MTLPDGLLRATRLLREGRPILVFDDDRREKEVDLFFAAEHATPQAVASLRKDAGGLVFLAVDPRVGSALGLPFLHDVFAHAADRWPVLDALAVNDLRYDARSSFSLTINHRKTFTGITDDDRSLTITAFAGLSADALAGRLPDAPRTFGASFRAPGHVHLCVGARQLLRERKGHTELGVALARIAGVTPVLAGAEMLTDGKARPREEAEAFARANGTVLVSGRDIEAAWTNLEAGLPRSA